MFDALYNGFTVELEKIAQGLGAAPRASLSRRLFAPRRAKERGRIGGRPSLRWRTTASPSLNAGVKGVAGSVAGMYAASKLLGGGQQEQPQQTYQGY